MEEIFQKICKNCGADFAETDAVNGVIKCRYCHSSFTLPKDGASPAVLSFLRQGEHDLDTCRFDEAYSAYEKAASLDADEPEAYFGMALAEFKVQYIKDAVNNCLQPVCHGITDKVFTGNRNFKRALALATDSQRTEYGRKGCDIDAIASEFYKLKQAGVNYDCFICVKVTDNDTGLRSADYKIADDIYFELRGKGYKPFFSERELRGVAGADYEARILYALYSAECMLVVCGNEEYLRTPWVKNEYTRFLKLVNDEEKESDSITIVFNGKPVEKLPGKNGKIQGIDFGSFKAIEEITAFVERHSPEGKARREEELKRRREKEEASERRLRELEEMLRQAYSAPQFTQVRETKKCEYCGELVDANLISCPVCGGNKFKTKADIERERINLLKADGAHRLVNALTGVKAIKEVEIKAQASRENARRLEEERVKREEVLRETQRRSEEQKARQDYERSQKEWAKIHDPDLSNYDKNLFEIQHTALVKYKGKNQTKVIIPRGINSIEAFAFKNCSGITEIVLPDGLQIICNYAFSKCSSLKELKIPSSVKAMGQGSFADLISVNSIFIPKSVAVMGKSVFCSFDNVLTIYCEAEKMPRDWHKKWARRYTGFTKYENNVIWGSKKP